MIIVFILLSRFSNRREIAQNCETNLSIAVFAYDQAHVIKETRDGRDGKKRIVVSGRLQWGQRRRSSNSAEGSGHIGV